MLESKSCHHTRHTYTLKEYEPVKIEAYHRFGLFFPVRLSCIVPPTIVNKVLA